MEKKLFAGNVVYGSPLPHPFPAPNTTHTHTNTRANGCLSKYNNQTFLLEMEGEKGMEWKLYHSAR